MNERLQFTTDQQPQSSAAETDSMDDVLTPEQLRRIEIDDYAKTLILELRQLGMFDSLSDADLAQHAIWVATNMVTTRDLSFQAGWEARRTDESSLPDSLPLLIERWTDVVAVAKIDSV